MFDRVTKYANLFIFKGKKKRSSVRTKRIGIAKCDLFFRYHHAKEMSFYYFLDTKLCTKHEKTHVNSIHIIGIIFVR